jgi:hypothetical protein
VNRRDLLRAALTVPVLAACTKKPRRAELTPSPGPRALQDVGGGSAPGLKLVDAEPDLVPGTARYAVGLFDDAGPLAGAKATVYVGPDPTKPPTASVPATELTDAGLGGRGLYVAKIPFPTAGDYYVAVVAETAKGSLSGGTVVTVKATSKSPVAGQRAPAVATPTAAHPDGADPLCSRKPKPCSLHAVSLDAALRSGRPTVVVFAAPAFCQTELCGPDVDIVEGVAKTYGDRANFIHVEAYRGATTPTNGKLAPALTAFRFDSEPWLYVIGKDGVVSDRIGGAFGGSELVDRLAKVGVS